MIPMTKIPKPHTLKRDAQKLSELIYQLWDLSCHADDASLDDATQLRDDIVSAAAALRDAIEIYEYYTHKPIRRICEDACGYSIDAFARVGGADGMLKMFRSAKAR